MKNFSLTQWIVIIILALLTALEPLCIDLYLPGFILISEAFNTSVSSVQISLSTFLGGFAVGQLIWGPLADRFGRKRPILISLVIFTAASVACIYVRTIEQLWVVRFLQALGGCAGVVISRAVVTDYFDKSKTLKIFSLLALIMGVAPIIAPSIGNGVLKLFSWEGLFGAMAILGVALFLFTLFFLPETHKNRAKGKNSVVKDYQSVLKVRRFVVYSIVAGLVNGALMVYVANGPFLIMEKGGFSSNMFSLIFSFNAVGLMVSSYLASSLQKYTTTENLVKKTLMFMSAVSVVLLTAMYMEANIIVILAVLFFYVFSLGLLLPATTELAITPFTSNSGTASAMFGSIQLLIAFVCSLLSSAASNGTMVPVGIALLLCGVLGVVVVVSKFNPKQEYCPESVRSK